MSETPAPPDAVPERMDKTHFSVVPLWQADDDNTFWHAQTPAARLAALERMRHSAYGYDAATARLSRLLAASPLREG